MNQAAGYMEAETQEPENDENNKDCPKHSHSLWMVLAHEKYKRSQAPTRTHHCLLVGSNGLSLCFSDRMEEPVGRGWHGYFAFENAARGDITAVD